MEFIELVRQRVEQVVDNQGGAVYAARSGYCARVVRQVLAPLYGLSIDDDIGFYALFPMLRVKEHESPSDAFWARDLQITWRALGWQVSFEERRGGDVCFSAELAFPRGHVGILLTRNFMLENTSTNRGLLVSGKNRLSSIYQQEHFGKLEFYRPQLQVGTLN